MTTQPDTPMTVTCGKHGERIAAVVCRHHINVQDRSVGFIENSSDPDDLQAWCDECEHVFLREGDKTDDFLRFNDFAVVCVVCYALLRSRHGLETAG